jgi:CheY-like chemotaxis protein
VHPFPTLGACWVCGLRFAGDPVDRAAVDVVRALHARHCAGGERSGEVWLPLRAVYESRVRRVVIVDDDPEIRIALRMLLESAGHRVEEAGDGAEALALCAARPPDVLVVDINLPDADGFDVAARIRERTRGATPRMIALTGYGGRDDRERARDVGFHEFLVKPADAIDLEALVATAPPLRRA